MLRNAATPAKPFDLATIFNKLACNVGRSYSSDRRPQAGGSLRGQDDPDHHRHGEGLSGNQDQPARRRSGQDVSGVGGGVAIAVRRPCEKCADRGDADERPPSSRRVGRGVRGLLFLLLVLVGARWFVHGELANIGSRGAWVCWFMTRIAG